MNDAKSVGATYQVARYANLRQRATRLVAPTKFYIVRFILLVGLISRGSEEKA